MTTAQIKFRTELIDTLTGSAGQIQLRQNESGFYFISPFTGNHFVAEKSLNKRVQAHWSGFVSNNLEFIK